MVRISSRGRRILPKPSGRLPHRLPMQSSHLASRDFTVPVTTALLVTGSETTNGSPSICLMPREMRSRSTSSPVPRLRLHRPSCSAHCFFAGLAPGQIGQMHQASIPPSRPINTPKSVMDLICPFTLSPFLWLISKSSQGLDWHCFMPRRYGGVARRFQDHHFHFVAQLHNLGRMNVLVGPVHFETCTRPSMPCSISTNAP